MTAPPDEQLPLRTRPPVSRWRLAFSLLVVAATAVGMLPDLLGLDRRGPFAQLVSFRPALLAVLLLVAVVATVSAVVRRRGWTLAAGLLVVAVVASVAVLPRALPLVDAPAPDAPGARTLTVLAFNTYEGRADVAALAALIRTTRPDLIALPESAGRFRDKIAPLVDGYRFAHQRSRVPRSPDHSGISPGVGAIEWKATKCTVPRPPPDTSTDGKPVDRSTCTVTSPRSARTAAVTPCTSRPRSCEGANR